MRNNQDPIGVFDSGVGGISALIAMMRILPEENFIYYGDQANAPYGDKSTQEVIRLACAAADRLLQQNAKALVIACNTATGAAAATLRRELTIPVIGMEPALKPAAEHRKNGSILVMATPLTLRQEKFIRLMEKYGEGAVKVPCPGLMEMVEQDDQEGAESYLREILTAFDLSKVDAIVLGCTHYVFLKDMIQGMIPEHVLIAEGSEGTARQLKRVLEREGLLNEEGPGSLRLQTSGAEKDLETMRRLILRSGEDMNLIPENVTGINK